MSYTSVAETVPGALPAELQAHILLLINGFLTKLIPNPEALEHYSIFTKFVKRKSPY